MEGVQAKRGTVAARVEPPVACMMRPAAALGMSHVPVRYHVSTVTLSLER
jgi:hypothetical protein